eukprot:jgi/Botrbrau1/12451/Bobra.0094s0014.1
MVHLLLDCPSSPIRWSIIGFTQNCSTAVLLSKPMYLQHTVHPLKVPRSRRWTPSKSGIRSTSKASGVSHMQHLCLIRLPRRVHTRCHPVTHNVRADCGAVEIALCPTCSWALLHEFQPNQSTRASSTHTNKLHRSYHLHFPSYMLPTLGSMV